MNGESLNAELYGHVHWEIITVREMRYPLNLGSHDRGFTVEKCLLNIQNS